MKRILSIIPYRQLVPPVNGGQLRTYYLLMEMATRHHVDLVCFQAEEEVTAAQEKGYGFPDNVTIHFVPQRPPLCMPFTLLPGRLAQALQYRWLRRSLRGPADINLLRSWQVLRRVVSHTPPDLVYFEHLSAMLSAPFLRRLCPGVPMVLDAHNVDHRLLSDVAARGGPDTTHARRKRDLARRLESSLTDSVQACLACSEQDRDEFTRLNGPGLLSYVVPNGVDTDRRPFDSNGEGKNRRALIFCGALDTAANRDGLLWFHAAIWPLVQARKPDLRLTVVGIGSEQACYDAMRRDAAVDFVGAVPEVMSWYRASGVALAPLRVGSGTRLKILEAMCMGNPVVSTPKGAEGLDCRPGEHYLSADGAAAFAEAVLALVDDPDTFHGIRQRARVFVAGRYDWHAIGATLNLALDDVMQHYQGGS